jgi:carbonic anhydrase
LRDHAFDISYAVAIGGVTAIALLAHTDCGMVAGGGWDASRAAAHFDESIPIYEIADAVGFVVGEASRLRAAYPAVLVAPLLYRVEDDRLLQIVES